MDTAEDLLMRVQPVGNRMRLAMGDQGGAVGLRDGEGLLVTAGVAWGDPDSFNGVMALQGPAQGVFAAATTNDEHPPQVGQGVGTGGRDGHGGKPELRGPRRFSVVERSPP